MFKSTLIIFAIFLVAVKAQFEGIYPGFNDEVCRNSKNGDLIQIDSECHYFYSCEDQVGYLDDCRNFCEGCQFDASINDCNYKEAVQCVSSDVSRVVNPEFQPRIYEKKYPNFDLNLCSKKEDGVLINIDSECYFYYYCVEQVAFLDDCRNLCDGCQFSTVLNDCDYERNVKCGVIDPPGTETTQNPFLVSVFSPACPPNQIMILESEDCKEYNLCAFGQRVTLRCLEGLVWNNVNLRCDYPVNNTRCLI